MMLLLDLGPGGHYWCTAERSKENKRACSFYVNPCAPQHRLMHQSAGLKNRSRRRQHLRAPLRDKRGRSCKLQRPRGQRLALAPSFPISLNPRSMSATVQLDFKACASASQGIRGVEMTPWAPPGLGALVPDAVAIEVDVGDCTVGLQGICEHLSEKKPGSKLQAAKTLWTSPGLGAFVSDLVVNEVDVSDRTVGL